MVKIILTYLLGVFALISVAQSGREMYLFPKSYSVNSNLELTIVKNTTEAKNLAYSLIINKQEVNSNDFELKTVQSTKSLAAVHYRFEVHYKQIPIYGIYVKLKTDISGNLLELNSNYSTTTSFETVGLKPDYYLLKNEYLIPVWQQTSETEHEIDSKIELLNSDGELQWSSYTYTKNKDSLVSVNIYKTDPITSSETVYGSPLSDRGDSIYPALFAEHFKDTLRLSYVNDSFKLENKYFKITDVSLPNIPAWSGKSLPPLYNRSEAHFEDFNVFYHLLEFRKLLHQLGHDSLGNQQIEVDAHGFGGADNSAYSNNNAIPRLIFGTGGVDDGEDAGIVVHEYTHWLTDFAAPKSNLGFQRRAIDEGLADYLCVSYLKRKSNYQWKKIFKWDGHNEFWDGREVYDNAFYPNDTNGTIYRAGAIATIVLVDIMQQTNQETADKLALESMYDLFPEMTLVDWGRNLLKADSLLFNQKNQSVICKILQQHGLYQVCFASNKKHSNQQSIKMINSEQFALGLKPLIFKIPTQQNISYKVYDSTGKIYDHGNSQNETIELNPNNFNAGIYILQLQNDNFKPVKFQCF